MSKKSILIILFSVLSVMITQVSKAAVINVATTQDNVPGSLRAAITTANTNGEDNTIYLPAGTYKLRGVASEDANVSGDLDIETNHKLTIIGQGKNKSYIDGNHIDRVFHILKGTVSISNVTLQNGKTRDGKMDMNGEYGGAIYNSGTLTLNNCCIRNNCTGGGGWDRLHAPIGIHLYYGGGDGGGIYNYYTGILNINRCLINNNITGSGGGLDKVDPGDGGDGAGICNDGILVITNSSIINNITGNGGQTDVFFYKTGIPGFGGGICNYGSLNIKNSAICNNSTGSSIGRNENFPIDGGPGGGIFSNSYANLENCTISNNMTGNGSKGWCDVEFGDCGSGGGILNLGILNLKCCTICRNSTGNGGSEDEYSSGGGKGGGIFNGGTINIRNTIVGDNMVAQNGEGPDCFGDFNSQDYNLIENIDKCTISGILPGNVTSIDPLLGPLADNGGLTKTHALLPGSPAIDAGNSSGLFTDQRGYKRPINIPGIPNVSDGADIGAYEYIAPNSTAGATTFGNNDD